ncbi:MAG: DUF4157 domain-containing protein [Candidatus Methanoperedens sp.]|nr:DUF4157 domain-containing protein [Candidatus Methanoperedens sp.]
MSDMVKISAKTPEVKKETKIAQIQKTDFSRSANPPVDRIMFFQRTIGNQAVQGLIKSGNLHSKPKKGRGAGKEAGAVRQIQGRQEAIIQQKCKECDEVQQKEKEDEEEKVCKLGMIQNSLVLGSPGDIYEQEADRVSQEVSNSRIFSMGNIQQEFISRVDVPEFLGLVESRGREISSKDKDGARRLRISTDCGGSCPEDRTVSPSLESRILESKGSGSALPLFIRKSMELQTGYDFSNVRVKTDSEAAGLNKSLGARAFTNGSDIWLGRNESVTDVKLMAHELTHVVQQGAAKRISPKSISVSGIRSKSKVLGYLQSLVKGSRHDSSVYHSDILQFQRENSPDKIMAMQQQILEKPNSSINNKENSGTLRGCLSGCTPSNPTPVRCPTQTVTMSGATCGASYGAVGRYCYSGATGWWFKERVVMGSPNTCAPGASIDQTSTPFKATGNCVEDEITNPNGPPSRVAPCRVVTNQTVFTGPTEADVEQCQYRNEQIVEVTVTPSSSPRSGKVITSSAGVSTDCNWS